MRAREPRAPPRACRVLWDLRARGLSPLGKQAPFPALRAHRLQAHLPPSPMGSPAPAPTSVDRKAPHTLVGAPHLFRFVSNTVNQGN